MVTVDLLKTLYVDRFVDSVRYGIPGITAKEILDGRAYKNDLVALLNRKGLDRCISLGYGKYVSPNFYYAGCASLFGLQPGGIRRYCQEISYVEKVGFEDDRNMVLDRCYSVIEKMYKIIVGNLGRVELCSLVLAQTPVNFKRAGDYIGFGLDLYFVEDYDFSYEG